MRSFLPAALRRAVAGLAAVRLPAVRLAGTAAGVLALSASVSACAFITGVPDVSRVQLQVPVSIIAPGQAVQINGVALGNGGNVVSHPRRTIVYRSENEAVATVSPSGLILGVAPGITRIIGSSGGRDGVLEITVRPTPVRQVLIGNRTPIVRLAPSITVLLAAAVIDTNNQALPNRPPTWRSLDTTVARISAVGAVTPRALGTTRIVASVDTGLAPRTGVVADTVTLRVTPTPVTSIAISPREPQPTLYTGQTLQFTATVVDSLQQVVTDRRVVWRTLDRGSVLAVDSATGLARAVAPSSTPATLTASVEQVEGFPNTQTITVQLNVAVLAPAASTRVVGQGGVVTTTVVLRTGGSQQLTFQALDALNTVLTGRQFRATSDTPGVVTATNGGLLTAGSTPGAATVTVQALDAAGSPQGTPATITVTVTP